VRRLSEAASLKGELLGREIVEVARSFLATVSRLLFLPLLHSPAAFRLRPCAADFANLSNNGAFLVDEMFFAGLS
jgi:hypothetical protein